MGYAPWISSVACGRCRSSQLLLRLFQELLTASPPGKKTSARQDQGWQTGTGDGGGDGTTPVNDADDVHAAICVQHGRGKEGGGRITSLGRRQRKSEEVDGRQIYATDVQIKKIIAS